MFKFKQFTVYQDKTPMKVGTDGVLIGAWATIDSSDKQALDIGCGTGVIALMIAQRTCGRCMIDAVEIDDCSAEQASENFELSPWGHVINIHDVSINDFNNDFKYDIIVSNPPFFTDSMLPSDQGRTTARHAISLSFSDLAKDVERLLSAKGKFSLILPKKESEEFEREAAGRLHLWRRCHVYGRVGADYKRVMSEYRLEEPNAIQISNLSIREANSNDYTQEYRDITADFYLKF